MSCQLNMATKIVLDFMFTQNFYQYKVIVELELVDFWQNVQEIII